MTELTELQQITLAGIREETLKLLEMKKDILHQLSLVKYTSLQYEYEKRLKCIQDSLDFNERRIKNIHRLIEK